MRRPSRAAVWAKRAQKSRSEARMEMARQIGAGVEPFDVQATLNGDHRLTYSEFANYTDVVPSELARSP